MNDATTDPMVTDDPEGPRAVTAESGEQRSTGDAHVDAALARLDDLDSRDLDQHGEVYDDIHRALGSALDGTSTSDPFGGAQRQREVEGS